MSGSAGLLLAALALDAVLGEPRWLWDRVPHPAVLMGRAVDALDARWNGGEARRLAGVAAVAVLLAGAAAAGAAVAALPDGGVAEVLLAAALLAQRSLVEHVAAVARGLRRSLAEGRRAVALIVGRDTGGMDTPAVARAAIESAAENLSDGVVAPVFWYLVAGLPGLCAYKALNTADSMIGHRTERHGEFGWAAARLDDAANWVPARLTAGLVALATWRPGALRQVRQEAPRHRSPNAGWPEAAMALSLGVALSGPRSYHGRETDDPFVNATGRRDIGAGEVDAAVALLWRSWWLLAAVVAAIAVA